MTMPIYILDDLDKEIEDEANEARGYNEPWQSELGEEDPAWIPFLPLQSLHENLEPWNGPLRETFQP